MLRSKTGFPCRAAEHRFAAGIDGYSGVCHDPVVGYFEISCRRHRAAPSTRARQLQQVAPSSGSKIANILIMGLPITLRSRTAFLRPALNVGSLPASMAAVGLPWPLSLKIFPAAATSSIFVAPLSSTSHASRASSCSACPSSLPPSHSLL
jgi:hypothetical protein